MFCMKCGTQLPDGANFCMNCGTQAGQTGFASPAPSAPAPAPMRSAVKEYNSERNLTMAYIPNIGLFYADSYNRLLFLPKGEKKSKVIVRSNANVALLFGLAFHNGMLYYWEYADSETRCGRRLMAINPVTFDKKTVFDQTRYEFELYLGPDDSVGFWDGHYYLLSNDGEMLYKIKAEDGSVTEIDTPDLRMGTIPEEWKLPTGYIIIDSETSQKRNYGERYRFFRALNGYGFVSLSGGAVCTAMFPLDNPNDFVCLPLDCCVTANNMGITTFVGDTLYSGGPGLRTHGFWKTENRSSTMLFNLDKYNLSHYCTNDWWKTDSVIFTGQFYYDIQSKKCSSMPKNFADVRVSDFVMDENGGAYLLSNGDVFYFPNGWEKNSMNSFYDYVLIENRD